MAVRRVSTRARTIQAGATSPAPGEVSKRAADGDPAGRPVYRPVYRDGQRSSTAKRRGQVGERAFAHVPVMVGRVTALLVPALAAPTASGRPPVLVDATLGRAGHARALLEACPGLLLIGIDADETAIEQGRLLAAQYPGQVTLAHAFYDQIAAIVVGAGHRRVQGILFDLGVSSPQLDDTSRGFSYSQDAPLDMRMDSSAALTAARVVNEYPVNEL